MTERFVEIIEERTFEIDVIVRKEEIVAAVTSRSYNRKMNATNENRRRGGVWVTERFVEVIEERTFKIDVIVRRVVMVCDSYGRVCDPDDLISPEGSRPVSRSA